VGPLDGEADRGGRGGAHGRLRAILPGALLVVDADPAVRHAVVALLSARGHEVITAVIGREALEVVAHARPRLDLLETDLPVVDGPGFVRAQRERGLRVPIVVMGETADHPNVVEEIVAVGRIGLPIRDNELLALQERQRAARRAATEPRSDLGIADVRVLPPGRNLEHFLSPSGVSLSRS
jgi:DNA-binding NtrC family response regulator